MEQLSTFLIVALVGFAILWFFLLLSLDRANSRLKELGDQLLQVRTELKRIREQEEAPAATSSVSLEKLAVLRHKYQQLREEELKKLTGDPNIIPEVKDLIWSEIERRRAEAL